MYRKGERVHYIVCNEDLVIVSLEHKGDVLAFGSHTADLLYSVEIFGPNVRHISNATLLKGYQLQEEYFR